jgi:NAD(P)H-hydrate epimerase
MEYPMSQIPTLTTAQMIEVDRVMLENYRISLVQMMENAGRNLAQLARTRFLEGNPCGKSVFVLAGTGGNGGGALVCARRLHNWGALVTVLLAKPAADYIRVPAQQLDAIQRMGISITSLDLLPEPSPVDLIIDGLIGYSLNGAPHGETVSLISWANGQGAPTLSLDTPSGLDTTSGAAASPCIRAAVTLTLALPKVGLLQPQAAEYVGELYLADISVPPELYLKTFNLFVPPLFAENDIIPVRL